MPFYVTEALLLPDGCVLTWSMLNPQRRLFIIDGQTGDLQKSLIGHTDNINGVMLLPDGRILSWSDDCTLRLWDSETGVPPVTLIGHKTKVTGALSLSDGRILSWSSDWSSDHTLLLWDGKRE